MFSIRQIGVVLTYLAVVAINALANILPLNGQNTGDISNSFSILFVPAGYVFSIWGLIYILLGMFAWYQFLPKQKEDSLLDTIGYLFIAGGVANISWIFLWHYNYPVLSVAAMLILLITLIMSYVRLKAIPVKKRSQTNLLIKLPISVYLGWISVATIANVSVALTVLEWNGFGLSDVVWTIIMIAIVTVLTTVMLVKEYNFAYASVIVWALLGIIVKQSNYTSLVITIIAAISVILCVMTVLSIKHSGAPRKSL